jgi:hypothetical protein
LSLYPSAVQAQDIGGIALPCSNNLIAIFKDSRGNSENSDGTRHDLTDKINARDCSDNEIWTFRYVAPDTANRPANLDTAKFYVYRGQNCNDSQSFNSEVCTEDTSLQIEVTPSSDGEFQLTAQQMLGDDGCNEGTDTPSLWIMLSPNDSRQFDAKHDLCELTVGYDLDSPDAPTAVETSEGDSALTVNWNESGSADTEGYLVCYVANEGTTVAADTPDASLQDGGADGAVASDGGTDADQGEGDAGPADASTKAGDADQGDGASTGSTGACGGGSAFTSMEACEDETPGCSCVHVDGATRQTRISDLSNDTTYAVAIAARDGAYNYGPFSTAVCETPIGLNDFFELYAQSDGGSKHCFVATAAYGGNIDHPDLDQLRWLRDEVIARLPGGSWLIAEYYEHGPGWASQVEDRPALAHVTREAIGTSVGAIRFVRTGGGVPLLLALGLFGACLQMRRKRNS